MKRILCIFALVAAVLSDSDLEAVLKKSSDEFTANMFQEVVKSQRDKSFVLSAFSVLPPLAQLALASVGESHDETLKAIGFPNDNVTKEVFMDWNSRVRSVKGVDLEIANKIYVREGYSLNDQFAALSKNIFNSEIENIDFQQSVKAAAEINAWIKDHTHKRIQGLVKPDSFDHDTIVFLVNAIYFKGLWKKPFKKYLTENRAFYKSKDHSRQLPMMQQSDSFKYTESKELDAKFLEIEYVGDETSFIVALPNKVDGINDLIGKFKDPSILNKARNNMHANCLNVYLPKFKIETTTNLEDVLEKMNIKKIFQSKEAKLYNLLKEKKNIYVSDAAQKAFIEVNEKGAEATVLNEFNMIRANSDRVFECLSEFKADHPFLFFIMEKNNILFSGVFQS